MGSERCGRSRPTIRNVVARCGEATLASSITLRLKASRLACTGMHVRTKNLERGTLHDD